MPAGGRSLPPEYFEEMYREDPDPWSFATREYEARKYAATLDALPRERYECAFEIGCSIGVLTRQLAGRCESLLSVDVSEQALAQARERCRDLGHVRFARMKVPDSFPEDRFDLIVVSEVGYYWSREDLQRARDLIIGHLRPAGQLILVHWTPDVADYPLTGDEVHEAFLAEEGGSLRHLHGARTTRYRLDLLERHTDSAAGSEADRDGSEGWRSPG